MRCRSSIPVRLAHGLAALRVAAAAVVERPAPRQVAVVPGEDNRRNPFHFELTIDPPDSSSVAYASFEDELHLTGWGILNVETNSAYADLQQAYAAGLVEGYLTAQHIYTTQANFFAIFFGQNATGLEQVPPAVIEFLDRQEAWMRVMVSEKGSGDSFWAHAGNILAQLDGLIAGYGVAAGAGHVPVLDRFSFQMLSAAGDMSDIIPGVSKQRRIDWPKLNPDVMARLMSALGHCTAMIKVTPDFSDLFIAHATWQDFSNTNRIFKHYNLNFTQAGTASRRVSFSSYPGILASQDDFYLMDSGLAHIQTSNVIVSNEDFDLIVPESMLAWQRARIAGIMASTAPEWFDVFRQYHSGTYANQYMIIDYKQFVPREPLRRNLLWVIEETPGLIIGRDWSMEFARAGYWPSYNVPLYEEIAIKSGYEQASRRQGNYFTYQLSPRAQIFRRDAGAVTTLDQVKAFIRYNNYLNDSLSIDNVGRPNPSWSICARGDLDAAGPQAGGCYDAKVSSYKLGATRGYAQAINGPTQSLGHGNLPPFSWSDDAWASKRHLGVPTTYDFDFVDIKPAPLKGFHSALRPGTTPSERLAVTSELFM